jgi:hypothetical protein
MKSSSVCELLYDVDPRVRMVAAQEILNRLMASQRRRSM